ncbi:hypothetical protein BXY66_1993 [Shimia isoporae]|uniref:Acid stress chaperone HdeA n=1 Tax=Shimia isoporae TaxID=647720 RepID=A0A4R1NN83_9RHOB|nr:hypothetical protein [Shimia isoporae]TCL09926.1 hypothetical protein BXY66_1993 [Shimia isoporae]
MSVSVFLRGVTALALGVTLVMPASAGEKEDTCKLQGEVMGAVQQARLERVKQGDVVDTVMAANPDWPASMAAAMPQVVDFVYSQKRKDLKKVDLSQTAEAQCLESWDQIKQMQGG